MAQFVKEPVNAAKTVIMSFELSSSHRIDRVLHFFGSPVINGMHLDLHTHRDCMGDFFVRRDRKKIFSRSRLNKLGEQLSPKKIQKTVEMRNVTILLLLRNRKDAEIETKEAFFP